MCNRINSCNKKMQSKTFTYQSSQIFYRSIGKGSPLILIHGFGEDGDIWENQIDFLKNHFQLIIPDLPGSGKSEIINDMSIEGMAEVIRSIIVHEKITSCSVAGHSMGGYIILALAEKYPSLITSFALVHSSAFADSEEKKATRLKAIEFIKKNGAYEFLRTTIPGLFTEQWAAHNKDFVEGLVEKSKAFSNEAIIAYYQAMINRPDRTTVLKKFNKPIMFIIGEHDKAIPFEQSMQQSWLPDQSYIHIMRNSAHMGMCEEAQKVNEILVDFMSAHRL